MVSDNAASLPTGAPLTSNSDATILTLPLPLFEVSCNELLSGIMSEHAAVLSALFITRELPLFNVKFAADELIEFTDTGAPAPNVPALGTFMLSLTALRFCSSLVRLEVRELI